ncbi:hypothetical protein G6L37_00125 [Agrobacterium rubi]|nr:hypothetical protein [Agrobacterium rubi]NTF23656.1 hypothetical protein [Agrobacterium rubi]
MLDDIFEEKVEAELSRSHLRCSVKVKPLDESKTKGWTDDKGRFCLPLSCGYYIAFPKHDEKSPLYMAWHHSEMVGGAGKREEAVGLAQEHHNRRILYSVELERYEPSGGITMYDGCYVELRNGDIRGPVQRRGDVEPHMRPWLCDTDAWFDNGGYRIQGGDSPWDVVRVLKKPADADRPSVEALARRIYGDARACSMGIDDPEWESLDEVTRERFIGYARSSIAAFSVDSRNIRLN